MCSAWSFAARCLAARGGAAPDRNVRNPAASLAASPPTIPDTGYLLARAGLILLGALLALGAVALTPAPARADTKTWTGVIAGANWTNDANWAGFVRPVPGDDLVFPANAFRRTTNNDYLGGTSFNSIRIEDSTYRLNGNGVTIADGQAITASYATGSSTINLTVSGNFTNITVTNPGATLIFESNLNNASGYVKQGSGTAVLLAPGSSLGWDILAGILNVRDGAAMGSGNTTAEPGATLQTQGGITVPNTIFLKGGGSATAGVESVSGNNTLTSSIFMLTDGTISADTGSTLTVSPQAVQLGARTLTAIIEGMATIASSIQGSGGLIKTGTGLLTLSGSNTYNGPTIVNAGTLLVNGSQSGSSVTVASGATLGGTGTTGPVTVNGTLSPGVGGPAQLHTGNAALNGGSTFAVDLNGTAVGSGYDQLSVTGVTTLSAPTLAVSVGFQSVVGNVFVILQSTSGLGGTFAGLPDGATLATGGRTFRINYTANAVTLTDVGAGATSTPTPALTVTPTITVTPTVTPTPCILGDINCDGIVDIRDYGLWRQNFGQTNCGNPADLDGTCIVDVRDYGIWRQNFGHTAGGATPGGAPPARVSTATATPTPTRTHRPASAVPAPLGSGTGVGDRKSAADPPERQPALVASGLLVAGLLWRVRRRRDDE